MHPSLFTSHRKRSKDFVTVRGSNPFSKGRLQRAHRSSLPEKKRGRRKLFPTGENSIRPRRPLRRNPRRNSHARSHSNPAHHKFRQRQSIPQKRSRIPNALRHPTRRTTAPRRRRPSLHRAGSLRRLLVSVVHAPPSRTPCKRPIPATQSFREIKPAPAQIASASRARRYSQAARVIDPANPRHSHSKILPRSSPKETSCRAAKPSPPPRIPAQTPPSIYTHAHPHRSPAG